MFNFMRFLNSFLPLIIRSIEYDGDNLYLSGEGWLFRCGSVWRVSNNKKIIFTCWDNNSTEMIRNLSGLSIINAEWFSDKHKIDPSFLLSDGKRIDVFCSYSCEPWIITLPDGKVYVGES